MAVLPTLISISMPERLSFPLSSPQLFLNAETQVIGVGGGTLTPVTRTDGSLTFTNGSSN